MPDQAPARIELVSDAKPWWKSRTMWFNAVCLAAAAAEPRLSLLQGVLPGGLYAWLAFVLPVGNFVLRVLTTTGVALKAAPAIVFPPVDAPDGGAS